MKKKYSFKINRMAIRYCLVLSGILFSNYLCAQDFHLSQYDEAALNLNPAMTGMFNGKHRIHSHYRTQWSSIASKPFTTTAISYDTPVKKFAWGAIIMDSRAGAGSFNIFSLMVSGAYDFSLDKENAHHISTGLQGGFIQKSFNIDKLYFNNQYSPFNGGSFDQSIQSDEAFNNTSCFIPDLNIGLVYYYSAQKSRINPFIGFSAYHLNHPTETFYSANNKLPLRYVIHSGFKFNLNETFQFTPKVLYMRQTNASEFTASLMMDYYLKDSETFILFGPTFRNKDAAIIEAGIKKGKYTGKLSYDINTSGLNNATNGRGGFEISLTYVTGKVKSPSVKSCPRL
jgi:type IX secretion system PorP/SprF family membrane protein